MKKKSIALVLAASLLLSGCSGATSSTDSSEPSSTDVNVSEILPVGDPRDAAADIPAEWGNVSIGCGGYTPEIYYNAGEEGLIYARADMGGAYRMDKESGEWIPLTDEFGTNEYSLYGIDGLATDPVETNRVYLLAGMYTTGWLDMHNAYILISEDYGDSWSRVELSFPAGGNEPNRFGDRLEIDPKDNKTLYIGARDGTLWVSHDYGSSWEQLPLPKVDYYQEDGYEVGVTFISFDADNTLYIGVAGKGKDCRIFTSKDGGATFEPLSGQPNSMIPYHGVYSPEGYMYFCYGNGLGPYKVTDGSLRRYTIATGEWLNITPEALVGAGVGDVELDPQNPQILTISSIGKWGAYENDNIYRSTDGGATWLSMFTLDGQDRKFTLDISDNPWLDWGNEYAKLGWMMGDLAINPFNGDDMMYGTGATIFRTTNLSELENGGTVAFKSICKGYEENAVNDLVSPPTGEVQLYSAMGDIDGFSHADVTQVPTNLNNNGSFSSASSIACAWLSPNIVARCGSGSQIVEISTDSGKSWKASAPTGAKGDGGTIAVNADGSAIYWSNDTTPGIIVSYDLGETWQMLEKIFVKPYITADCNDPDALYVFAADNLYVSRDKGASFEKINQFVPMNSKIISNPAKAGDIWLVSGGGGIFNFPNYGADEYTRCDGLMSCMQLAFGKAQDDSSPLAMYAIGTLKDTDFVGVYVSLDGGISWLRMNDGEHEFGSIGASIAADMNVFGRVYFGTNGRGIIMGTLK